MTPPDPLPALLALLATPEPPALDATPRTGTLPAAEVEERVRAALDRTQLSPTRRQLILALALLWHDHLDAGHSLAQEVKNTDGSFVHAIMHRREPDAWNAKYWWQRVGVHPAFAELARRAAAWLAAQGRTDLSPQILSGGRWDAAAFTDACDAAAKADGADADVRCLRQLQRLETEVLLAHLVAAR